MADTFDDVSLLCLLGQAMERPFGEGNPNSLGRVPAKARISRFCSSVKRGLARRSVWSQVRRTFFVETVNPLAQVCWMGG